MEQFWLENQGTASYLVYALEENDELDSMSLGMLTNNVIDGIAKTYYMQLDQKRTLRYDVSAQIPLEQFYTGTVSRERLLKTFYGISEALITAENYMIPLGNVMLDLGLIYVSVATCAISLICLPLTAKNTKAIPLREFFRGIMFNIQFDQSENCDYISTLINYLNGTSNFSLQEFCQTLRKLLPDDKTKAALYNGGQGEESKKPGDKKVVMGYIAQPTPRVPQPPRAQVPPQPRVQAPVQVPVQVPVQPQPQAPVYQQPQPPQKPKKQKKQPRPVQPAKGDAAAASGVSAPQMQIPGRPAVPPTVPQSPTAQPTAEKSISLFYLLQHYNKENAALYRAQKAEKKAAKSAGKPPKKGKGDIPNQVPPTYQPKDVLAPEQIPVAVAASRFPGAADQVPQQGPAAVPRSPFAPPSGDPAPMGDFGNTSFCFLSDEDDGGTVILGQEQPTQQLSPHLIRKSNQERIPIDKPIFRLGRDAGFNDYVVNNPAVGHSHCYIVTRDNEYFIVDSNSKNHTKVDGVVIPSGQEIKLAHGCIVFLANEEFEFRLF